MGLSGLVADAFIAIRDVLGRMEYRGVFGLDEMSLRQNESSAELESNSLLERVMRRSHSTYKST